MLTFSRHIVKLGSVSSRWSRQVLGSSCLSATPSILSTSFPRHASAAVIQKTLPRHPPQPESRPEPQPQNKLTVNGKEVTVPSGATLLDAIRAAGSYVPTLCFHPRFKAQAMCRVCTVEVTFKGQTKLQPACATLACDQVSVKTHSDKLKEFRRTDVQLLLARHPNDCMLCEVNGSCKLQQVVRDELIPDKWPKIPRGDISHPEHELHDHTSPAIDRDMAKCIECGLCVAACGPQGQNINVLGFGERGSGMVPVTAFDRRLAESDCISCGQCTAVCPVGALVEEPHWHKVLTMLDSRTRPTVVQMAPATRVAISEEFGMTPGTCSTDKMVAALRMLGFDFVFDTNFAADLTIMEEGTELLGRLAHKPGCGPLPIFTSCCPAWVNWLEINRPELLSHLSTAKSPQQMLGAVVKRLPVLKERISKTHAWESTEPYVVSVMPCTAKKGEALRPGLSHDVDAVLTTRELARMIRARNIPFAALVSGDHQGVNTDFDRPLGESTGAAVIFGASGGVMEAALRSAIVLAGLPLPEIDFHDVRGVAPGIKVAKVEGVGEVAVCSGIASAQELLANDDWKRFVAIEVMSCVGGCLGGGGEPKSIDRDVLAKRAKGLYAIDQACPKRQSHLNQEVQQLYKAYLKEPLSHKSEEILHTTYSARKSPRAALSRFLDAVDRRDASGAAAMFSPQCVWQTSDQNVQQATCPKEVERLIKVLPSNGAGPDMQRHRFADSADGCIVIQPDGTKARFEVQLDASGLISSLRRHHLG
eukprot:g39904.t1